MSNTTEYKEPLSELLRKEIDDLIFRFDWSKSPRIFAEGKTDHDFFDKHITISNKGAVISLSRNDNSLFSKKAVKASDNRNNNKELVLDIIDYIDRTHNDWKAYALVDRDHFDDAVLSDRIICDQNAHDIETMMMGSDNSLMAKCSLSNTQKRNAFFYSYQYGKIQTFIKGSKGVHLTFDNFTSDNISKVINRNSYEINVRAIFRQFKKDIEENRLDEYLTRLQMYYPELYILVYDKNELNLKWIAEFELDILPDDLFTTMRGHDLADIVRYIRHVKVSSENDRSVETEWNEKYECISCFDNTGLYQQLNSRKLIKNYYNYTPE